MAGAMRCQPGLRVASVTCTKHAAGNYWPEGDQDTKLGIRT